MKLNNSWTKKQQQKKHRQISSDIGLEYDIFIKTTWEIIYHGDENEADCPYTIKFIETPEEILRKIPKLGNQNEIFVSNFKDYHHDFVDYQDVEPMISSKPFYGNLYSTIFNLRQLNALYISEAGLLNTLRKQIYVNAIGAMETYLEDVFIFLISNNDNYFKDFVRNFPKFNKQKIKLSSIFEEIEKLKEISIIELQNIVYHNLGRIKPMYEKSFNIKFPDIDYLSEAVITRHDIVHRDGKNKLNQNIKITPEKVDELLSEVVIFSNEVCRKLELNNNDWMKNADR